MIIFLNFMFSYFHFSRQRLPQTDFFSRQTLESLWWVSSYGSIFAATQRYRVILLIIIPQWEELYAKTFQLSSLSRCLSTSKPPEEMASHLRSTKESMGTKRDRKQRETSVNLVFRFRPTHMQTNRGRSNSLGHC